MGMSEAYGTGDWDASIGTIKHALDLGVTMIDTADIYGFGHNEVLVGRAIRGRRDEVQLATKAGIDRTQGDAAWVLHGDAAYIKQACHASLTRLNVDHIDLFYLHRPPQTAQIEEAVGAMAELVSAGKVRYLGLSEVGATLLRRANAVHPIAAVQNEYSLWHRESEDMVVDALRDLGTTLVAFSPLGHGFLTGTVDLTSLEPSDVRNHMPRFADDANQPIVQAIRDIAANQAVTAAQVALAWVHSRTAALGVTVVPIPGTKQVKWLDENISAMDLRLADEDLAILDQLASRAVGPRTNV
jgi:aryl-alcohol dehydrogenase-like predicted oxidoreductase